MLYLVQSWNVQSFPRSLFNIYIMLVMFLRWKNTSQCDSLLQLFFLEILVIDLWSRKKYKKYPGNILGLTFAGSRLENSWDLVKTSHGVDNVRFGKVLGNKKS
jgi:hypothetical protein